MIKCPVHECEMEPVEISSAQMADDVSISQEVGSIGSEIGIITSFQKIACDKVSTIYECPHGCRLDAKHDERYPCGLATTERRAF